MKEEEIIRIEAWLKAIENSLEQVRVHTNDCQLKIEWIKNKLKKKDLWKAT